MAIGRQPCSFCAVRMLAAKGVDKQNAKVYNKAIKGDILCFMMPHLKGTFRRDCNRKECGEAGETASLRNPYP